MYYYMLDILDISNSDTSVLILKDIEMFEMFLRFSNVIPECVFYIRLRKNKI